MATYTAAFEKAIDHCMLYEVGGFWNEKHPAVAQGLIDTSANRKAVGFVNNPADRGGVTKFGIASKANPDLNITTLTWDQAKAAYYLRYWLAGKCDQLPSRVAVLHFDGCTNNGIGGESVFLQRAVGVLADGKIGSITLAKVASMDQIILCGLICDQREQFYRQNAASNPSQQQFLGGWLRRVSEMRAFVTDQTAVFD